MKWLDDRIYEKEEIQNNWSIEEWRNLWAQLMKVITEAVWDVKKEYIYFCDDPKQKHRLEIQLKMKQKAEKEILSWDLSKMSFKVKLLIKAQLMQCKKYHRAVKKYSNLKELDNINRPKEEFDIRIDKSGVEPLCWYYNLNIRV